MAKHLAKGFRNVILAGLPGAGKSTFGKTYAHFSGRTFIDFDAYLENLAGRTIPQIFAAEGEEGFRAVERMALQRMDRRTQSVIALGGGTLCSEENFALLRAMGLLVFLSAPHADLARRVEEQRETRPMFAGLEGEEAVHAKIALLWEARAPFYERCDLVLDTGFASVDALKIQLGLLERRILLHQKRLRLRDTEVGEASDRDEGGALAEMAERIPDSALRAKDEGAGDRRESVPVSGAISRALHDVRAKGHVRLIQKETRAGVLGLVTGRPSLAKEMETRLPSGGRPRRAPKKGEDRDGRGPREGREPRDPNETREGAEAGAMPSRIKARGDRPPREPNAPRENRPPREPNAPRENRPPREPNAPRENRPPRDPNAPQGQGRRDGRPQRDNRPPRDPGLPRENRSPRDPNQPRQQRENRLSRDPNAVRENRQNGEPREPNASSENRPPRGPSAPPGERSPRGPNQPRELREPRLPQSERPGRESEE